MGLAQRALDEATKYSMERKTMGKFICEVSKEIGVGVSMWVGGWVGVFVVRLPNYLVT